MNVGGRVSDVVPAPQVTVDVSMPQILKDVGLSPLGPISERNCLRNADDPIPRVPSMCLCLKI